MDQTKHLTKILQTRRMRKYLKTDCAVYIPNFMLSFSATFKLAFVTLSASDILGNTYLATSTLGGIDIDIVAIALRSSIVNYLFDYIVYLAQNTIIGPNRRFNRTEHIGCKPELPENLQAYVKFSHTVSTKSKSTAGSGKCISSTSLDPIMICGLRQIGKSHIMFHLAARMLAEEGVVVVYIGDPDSLIVNGSSDDRYKYERFVTYVASAFSEYPKVNKIVEKWYSDTDSGQRAYELRPKTIDFLCQLRTLCEEEETHGITPVFFIDSHENMATNMSSQVIVSAHELAHTYGFLVILSTTQHFDPRSQGRTPMNLCHLSMPLSESDAVNVLTATHNDLRMTRSMFRRLYDDSDSHVYDFVNLLELCSAHPTVSDDTIEKAISAYDVRRRMRLTHMNACFYTKLMDTVVERTAKKDLVYSGPANNVITLSTPELRKEHQRIISMPFMLYHNLDLQLDAVFDPQFISKRTSSDLSDSNHSGSIHDLICCPQSAIETMYRLHFDGSVMTQFSWLLDMATHKIDIEPPVRIRLFDLIFLETQWTDAEATNPLTRETWRAKLRFSAVTSHNYKEYSHVRNPRDCQTFEKAVHYVARHIRETRSIRCMDLYDKTSTSEVRDTVIVYLPDINFKDWPDKSISADTSFAGSFMVAITRVDIPSQPADKCRFEITWIASDPLRAISMDEKIEHISDWPPNRHRTVAENRADRLQLSRDMCDFDSIYGCSQSWTAKAIRIFPALKNMCQNAIPEDALGYVRMLTLTDTSRAESIFEQNQLTTLEPELTKFTYEMSRDIATIKIGDIKQLRNQIKRYF